MMPMKRLLIAGFGDIARRAVPFLEASFGIRVLSRVNGMDLDQPASLAALEPADAILHCAPPPPRGATDTRTANLLIALESTRILPTRVVYISTSGVYGDCGGALVDESRAPNPQSERARRRADAEARLALWCQLHSVALVVLRAPGIYAADRLPPDLLSFMSESRRLDNTRLKRVLGATLRYPTVREGLEHANAAGAYEPA